jgi:hypothetical protein
MPVISNVPDTDSVSSAGIIAGVASVIAPISIAIIILFIFFLLS